MADIKVFNNLAPEELAKGDGLKVNDGWEKTTKYDDEKINKIKDTIEGGGIGYFKLGTSIPTPFARIFMFRNAFNRIGENVNDTDTIYGKLVSENLDFLEFLYHYGKAVTIKKWSFDKDIKRLKGIDIIEEANNKEDDDDPFGDLDNDDAAAGITNDSDAVVSGHKLLAECLENQRAELDNIENIYLIYYKGELMGGTSPFTVVFTSPNWQRRKSKVCSTLKGVAGNVLFPDYQDTKIKGTPLHQRDPKFVAFMLYYLNAYTSTNENALLKYIGKDLPAIEKKNSKLKAGYDILHGKEQSKVRIDFEKKYDILKDENDEIINLAYDGSTDGIYLPLATLPLEVVSTKSDYTIKADYEEFSIIDKNEKPHPIKDVLVLTDSGKQGAKYMGGQPWNPADKPNPSIVDVPLYERILPGPGSFKQPFITVYDLFEDYLVKLPYSIDSERFETFVSRGKWNFLLPLKGLFFNFFKKERLEEFLTIEAADDDSQVTFTLRIPITFEQVKNKPEYLDVKKVYKRENIKELRGGNWFALGIFPTFRVMGNNADNEYSLMAANGKIAVTLDFYNATKPQKALPVECTERLDDIKSKFYHVKEAFDYIQTTSAFPDMAAIHAIIIPKFVPAYVEEGESNWRFAIDFGTTNTYVAATETAQPATLEILKNEAQVMYLDKINVDAVFGSEEYDRSLKESNVAVFHDAANREFAPMTIGPNCIASYPFQTATCEAPDFKSIIDISNGDDNEQQSEEDMRKYLFSKLAIGYNLNHEEFSKNYVYRTDIKWAPEKEKDALRTVAINRQKLYCQQIAWMLKNKMALSSSETAAVNRKFTVFYTYPCSMGDTEKDNLEKIWRTVFGPNATLVSLTESEAPYYYLTREGSVAEGKNFLNIDIGGGTTDMFFVIQEKDENGRGVQKSYYTSMRFAGNDLWGDGVKGLAPLTNGFYQYAKANMPSLAEDIEKQENLVLQNPDSTMGSADTMAFLFRHDKQGLIPNLIQSKNSTLYPLLLVHFGAIIYHLSMILNANKWDIPKNINLTGMGSKYVNIIASQKSVTKLTAMLLEKFTKKKVPSDFKLTYSPNAKEVTAQGALYKEVAERRGFSGISGEPEEFRVYGFNADKKLIKFEKTELENVRKEVIEEYKKFIHAFLDDEDIEAELKMNFCKTNITSWLRDGLLNKAEDSYVTVTKGNTDPDDFVRETLFFWPLKNAIYELSREGLLL